MEQLSKSQRIAALETKLLEIVEGLGPAREPCTCSGTEAVSRFSEELTEIRERLRCLFDITNAHERDLQLMADATADLKAAQEKIRQAVQDTANFIKSIAGKLSGAVSAEDAESIASDLTAQAEALETAIAPQTPADATT